MYVSKNCWICSTIKEGVRDGYHLGALVAGAVASLMRWGLADAEQYQESGAGSLLATSPFNYFLPMYDMREISVSARSLLFIKSDEMFVPRVEITMLSSIIPISQEIGNA